MMPKHVIKSMKFMMYDSKKRARERSRASSGGGEKSRAW